MVQAHHNPMLQRPVCSFQKIRRGRQAEELAFFVRQIAEDALRAELLLTPKPGLVDRRNHGAHYDMDLGLFLESIAAIAPFFADFFLLGHRSASLLPHLWLGAVRQLGRKCEKSMFAATKGINTHKGAVFALGLLCAAAGYYVGRNARRNIDQPLQWTREALCAVVAQLCQGLVRRELPASSGVTAGERIFKAHGLAGARGEAESGFRTVRHYGLPVYDQMSKEGQSRKYILHQVLLTLLAVNEDTNLVARGGEEGLSFVQTTAQALLKRGGSLSPDFTEEMALFDAALIKRHLSPGGSADLLAVSCFLAQFPADVAGSAAYYFK